MIPWTWCRTGDSRRAPIWLLAGFGPIDVEVPGRGRQPPLVPAPHRELGDDPLPALEVAVEHAEREIVPRLDGGGQRLEDIGCRIPLGTLPQPDISGRHVDIPDLGRELLEPRVGPFGRSASPSR